MLHNKATIIEAPKKLMQRSVQMDGRTDISPEQCVQTGMDIRGLREVLRIGQREAAAKAGVSLGIYNTIENGLCYNQDSIHCARIALLGELSGALRIVANIAADTISEYSKRTA